MAKKKEKGQDTDGISKELLEQLAKRMGVKNDDMKLGSEHVSVTDVFTTGNSELDSIITPSYFEKTGKGGVPRGFLCEFYGPNAGGKSSLCLKIAGFLTTLKKAKVFWVDAENSFMEEWAQNHGVNLENLVMCPFSENGESYLTKVEIAASSGMFQLVVIDSLEALIPKALLEQGLEENAKIGAKAQMMSRACSKLVQAARKGHCTIIFINQIRNKITMYGDPETTPGGEALRFYASLRLRISQVSGKANRGITKDGEEIGIRSNVLVKKSRFGPPYKETILSIYYGDDKPHPLDMLIDLAMSNKIIKSRTKKVKGTSKNAEEEDVQVFTFEPINKAGEEIEGFDYLEKIEGFDAFKAALNLPAYEAMIECLQNVKKEKVDPEILFCVEQLKKEDMDSPSLTGDAPVE